MDLFSIPISFKHWCDSLTCYNVTDSVTVSDLNLLVIGINCMYVGMAIWFYLDYKKRKYLNISSKEESSK